MAFNALSAISPIAAIAQAGQGGGGGGGGQQQGQQQPFGYDPSNYITEATKWAENWLGKGDTEYQFAKDQFAKNEGVSDAVVKAAQAQAGLFDDASRAGLSRYEQMYAPAMKEQMDFARGYASPERMARARGQAMAGVGQAFDAQADEAARSLKGYGLDPMAVSSRLDSDVRTKRAAAEAGAGTQSDINTELIGQQLIGQAINTGMQDQAITGQQAGLSQAARNQAVNTGLATTASGVASRGSAQGWAGLGGTELKEWPKASLDAMHASNEQGSLWNDVNKTNLAAQEAAYNRSSGTGSLIGAGLGTLASLAPLAFSGGVVPEYQEGGEVEQPTQAIQTGTVVPPGAGVPSIPGPDNVPALVAEGEGVLPKDVMDWLGEKGFQQLIAKARKERQTMTQTEPKEASPEAVDEAAKAGPQFASEGASGGPPAMRAGGMVHTEVPPNPSLQRGPYRPNTDVPKGTDPMFDRGPYEPWREERGEQDDEPDEPEEDFEYGSPRHPRFPNMYEPRDDEHYDTPGPGAYQEGGRVDPLATAVNRATRDEMQPRRVSPLSEWDTLGPRWQGPQGRGRMVDEFRRDRNISEAADEADRQDREEWLDRRRRAINTEVRP